MTEGLALYPGSFDPIHNGHLDVIERAARMFGSLRITVFVNSSKAPLFSAEERVALVKAATSHIPGIVVEQSRDLLVRYAQNEGIDVIIRGLRAVLDFDYEFQIALMNRKLAPTIETIFMLTSEHHAYLSSTLVKELARYGADIEALVPSPVAAALVAKFAQTEGDHHD
ncbi:MAG: pantetheine-phosphate adenylyltransferase [Sulfobacillus sp.]